MERELPKPPWKIAVVGAGAVGCYYGARLAKGGHDVHFLFRRDLQHVLAHGLEIRSYQGDFRPPNLQAYGSTSEIGPCDLVLIALKTTSNAALVDLLPPLLAEHTALITLQNGLGNEEFLAERFSSSRVLGGVCFTCINRTAPGQIEHTAQGKIGLGEYASPRQPRTVAMEAEFNRCGIECEAGDSLGWIRWKKLVWNVPFNGLAIAAGGLDTQNILADPGLEHLVVALMEEIIAVAAHLGHLMPDGLIKDQLERTRGMGPYRPSSMIDFVEGRDVEVEAIWGEPWRMAVRSGAAAPRLEMLYHLLHYQVSTRRGNSRWQPPAHRPP